MSVDTEVRYKEQDSQGFSVGFNKLFLALKYTNMVRIDEDKMTTEVLVRF